MVTFRKPKFRIITESFVYIIHQETVDTRRQINCPKEEYSVLDFSCGRFGLLEKVYLKKTLSQTH